MLNILGLRSILKAVTSVENSSVALSLAKHLWSILQQDESLITAFKFSESSLKFSDILRRKISSIPAETRTVIYIYKRFKKDCVAPGRE